MSASNRSLPLPAKLVWLALLGGASICLAATKTDPNATVQTRALYDNLFALSAADATAFGQQFATFRGIDALTTTPWQGHPDRSDIKTVTDYHPAVTGWNIHTYLNELTSAEQATFVQGVKDDYLRNTIITFHWTMNNPINKQRHTNRTGVSASPTVLVQAITPGYTANTNLIADLDAFAALLNLLVVDGKPIPIIFRPFHEMTDDSAWWQSGNPGEFAALWNYVLQYLRDTKGVHNLLYIYAPAGGKLAAYTTTEYLGYWPGDASVDICGIDLYKPEWFEAGHLTADAAALKGTPAAFSELGPGTGKGIATTPNQTTWWTSNVLKDFADTPNGGANPLWPRLAYMMTWTNAHVGNYFVPYSPNHSQAADFNAFVGDGHILLQPDLPPMYVVAPMAPGNLVATAASSYQVDLAWSDDSDNEDGFKIERSTDDNTFSQVALVGADATSYTDAGLATSTTYYYRVRAYNLAGASGYSNTANVTLRDIVPPVITSLSASPTELWPANHKLVAVSVSADATDAEGVTSLQIVSVTSNEPDNGLGDGDTDDDIAITGPLSLMLRAERSGTGNGRIYTITVEARDAAGNAATSTIEVKVPANRSNQ